MGITLIAVMQASHLLYIRREWARGTDAVGKAMLLLAGLGSMGALTCCALIGLGY